MVKNTTKVKAYKDRIKKISTEILENEFDESGYVEAAINEIVDNLFRLKFILTKNK